MSTFYQPSRRPVVGVMCNRRTHSTTPNMLFAVSEKYAQAIRVAAGATPVLLAGLGDQLDIESVLQSVDGVLLTGGASNIEPHHYGQAPATGDDQRDAGRDAFVLSLIPRALELGLPLLGVCRGIQEVNVALGGTLHQRLHDVAGRMDHRRPREKPWHEHFEARQRVSLRPDGPIAALADADEAMVNSLHGQGIDALGNGLVIEATADDGTIEAVSVPDSDGFALAVQWHAEHEVVNHPLNLALFAAFGAAARAFANQRILAQAKAIQNLPA